MSAQSVEEKPNKEKKPRFFWRGFSGSFVLAEDKALAFKSLVKHFRDEFLKAGFGSSSPLPLAVDSKGWLFRFMDSGRYKMVDAFISKVEFEEFHVDPFKRFRMVELPVSISLPTDELLYALESVDGKSTVKFSTSVLFKGRLLKYKTTVRKPERCPKCGSPVHPSLNMLPAEERGPRGNLYKCKCGKRFKVRERERLVKTWDFEVDRTRLVPMFNIEVERGSGDVERFEVEVLSPTDEEPPIPKFNTSVSANVVLKPFREILHRIAKKCSRVRIEADRGGLTVSARGDMVKAEFPIKRGSNMLLKLKAEGKAKTCCDVKYLISCLPVLGETASISYAEDMPIKTEISMANLAESRLNFYLAPVIETS